MATREELLNAINKQVEAKTSKASGVADKVLTMRTNKDDRVLAAARSEDRRREEKIAKDAEKQQLAQDKQEQKQEAAKEEAELVAKEYANAQQQLTAKSRFQAGRASTFGDSTSDDGNRTSALYRKDDVGQAGLVREGKRSLQKSLLGKGKLSEGAEDIKAGLNAAQLKEWNELNQSGDAGEDASVEILEEAAKKQARAAKEQEDALQDSSKAIKDFGNTMKSVGNAISQAMAYLKGGNESALTTMKVATETGMTVEQTRELEYGFGQNTDLTSQEGLQLLGNVGDLRAKLTNPTDIGDFADTQAPTMAQLGIQLDYNAMAGMSTPELLDYVQNLAGGLPEDKQRKFYDSLNLSQAIHLRGKNSAEISDFVTTDVDGNGVPDHLVDEDKQRDAKSVIAVKEQTDQNINEAVTETTIGNLPPEAGLAISGTELALGAGGTLAASKLIPKLRGGASKLAGKVPNLSGKAGSLIKKLPKGAVKGGLGGLALLAAREGLDVEDDGGLADSALDVAEFAATGAMLGSFIPGAGTLVGGAVGGGLGLLNEGAEALNLDFWNGDDDIIESLNRDQQPQALADEVRASMQGDVQVHTNVEVVNNLSPELIQTQVSQDGDLTFDTEEQMTGVR